MHLHSERCVALVYLLLQNGKLLMFILNIFICQETNKSLVLIKTNAEFSYRILTGLQASENYP